MDYEKKYKEALKRAREIIQDYKKRNLVDILFYAKEDLESIFPELKESEDELTWLTKYIEEEAYSLSMDIRDNEDRIKLKKLKKALAWLEKQGQTFTNRDVDDAFVEGMVYVKSELEKQGKNKDLPNITDRKTLDEYACQVAYDLSNDWLKDTPTWDDVEKACKLGAKWNERHHKPAEWSEEGEVKINRIVACLENLNVADNDILLKDVDWLKSLRPQNRWKPTDEQMKALKYVAYHLMPDTNYRKEMFSLYEDLKKLKGE